jgi:hypothetical protein
VRSAAEYVVRIDYIGPDFVTRAFSRYTDRGAWAWNRA